MNWFMKLYWVFGMLGAFVCFGNPLVGLFGMLPLFMIFFLGIWDINMRQRMRYYQNPQKQYQIGKGIKGAEQVHALQQRAIPYSLIAVCTGGKIVAVFSVMMQIVVEAGVAAGVIQNANRGYYHSMSPFHMISEEQYLTVGIPLCMLGIVLGICMAISFWQRCEYYKNSVREN